MAQIKEEIGKIVGDEIVFSVERPEDPEHGDYSSNVALVLSKKEGKNPKEVAERIKDQLGSSAFKLTLFELILLIVAYHQTNRRRVCPFYKISRF